MKLMSRWRWLLRKISRKLWLTTVLYSLGAIAAVLLAPHLQYYVPDRMNEIVSNEAVKQLLNILATSMLAVTTFSLTTMISANNSVRNNTSPRASMLILNDGVTRNALGAFIGGFIFSLIGIISINANLFDDRGHIILFFGIVIVITIIIIMLLRWIEYLMGLGKISNISEKVEEQAAQALQQYADTPNFGCRPLSTKKTINIPKDAQDIYTEHMGYVQHIDLQLLRDSAKKLDGDLYILVVPGDFVDAAQPVAKYTGQLEGTIVGDVAKSFSIDALRSYDYDPRFGLTVLSEIAQRALSPGVNDPGTAIDIITRLNRILHEYITQEKKHKSKQQKSEDAPKNLWMRSLDAQQMLEISFIPIARDGCGHSEVHLKLHECYISLYKAAPKAMQGIIRELSKQSLSYMEQGGMIENEVTRLKKKAL